MFSPSSISKPTIQPPKSVELNNYSLCLHRRSLCPNCRSLCPHRLLLLLFLLFSQSAFSQQFSYRSLDKAHGMPTNTIYDLMQDKRGFMWFGTDKGLYRYDGTELKLYSSKKQDGKSLSNLMEDANGRIWCQNFSGQFFYTEADSLHFCENLTPIGTFYQGRILQGRYLFTMGNKSIRILDVQSKKLTQKPFQDLPSPHASIDNRFCYRYVGNLNKIIGISPTGSQIDIPLPKDINAFYHIVHNGKFYFLPKINATHVFVLENGKITDKISLEGQSLIQNISLIDEQYLGVYTSSGFYLIDVANRQKRYFPNITDKNITSVVKDHEGNFWISTINSGVLFVPSLSIKVIEPQLSFSTLQGVESEDKLFLGTSRNEVYSLNLKTLQKQNLFNGHTNDEVVALFYDNQRNNLLFSSDIFYRIDKKNIIKVDKYAIKDIEAIDEKTVFMAATGFVGSFDWNAQNKITQLSEGNIRFRSIAIDKLRKDIFLATSNGLLKLDSTKKRTEIKYQNETISALDLAIRQSSKSTIFAATSTKGIYFIENDKIINHLTKAAGLEDDGVYKIKYYKNQLWWLTEKAVQSYDFATKKIKTYTKADGLPETDLKDLIVLKDTVYVATLAGLVSFPTNQAHRSVISPKIIIHDFEVNKVTQPLQENQSWAYNQNNIDINFSVLSYRSASELKIFYRINNKAWIQVSSNLRSLSLPQLSPDDYNIQLKAVDTDGLESEIVALKFSIKQPFWRTFWFWAMLVGVVAVIVYTLTQQYLRRLKREADLKAEKLTLEKDLQVHLLTAIKSQMNQHFMYNTLNSIQEQFLYGNKNTASEQLSNFTHLTRQILETSGQKSIPLAVEVEILTKYLDLEKMRFNEEFSYEITFNDTIDEDYHQIPPLLIQPFVENAIRHSLLHKKGEKHLSIYFALDEAEENIICTVEDNGIGRAKAEEINAKRFRQFDSFSTTSAEQRLRLLRNHSSTQDLIIYEDLAEGTRVKIIIPF